MKIKTTFYNRTKGKDFDPVLHVDYPKSRADQLSYQPTASLVDQMFKTGQMVQSSKALYDFPDGKDDGRDVPLDRVRGLDFPEISQAMNENEAKLDMHEKNLKELSAAGKSKDKAKKSENKEERGKDDDDAGEGGRSE